jgi:BolA protein
MYWQVFILYYVENKSTSFPGLSPSPQPASRARLLPWSQAGLRRIGAASARPQCRMRLSWATILGAHLGWIGQTFDSPPMTNSPSRADRLHAALTHAFAPAVLQVRDDSASHAGHSGAPAGGQSHYSVLLVSAAFHGLSRVARSRVVHSALAAEFGPAETGGMHALALTLRTPEEHAAQPGE